MKKNYLKVRKKKKEINDTSYVVKGMKIAKLGFRYNELYRKLTNVGKTLIWILIIILNMLFFLGEMDFIIRCCLTGFINRHDKCSHVTGVVEIFLERYMV